MTDTPDVPLQPGQFKIEDAPIEVRPEDAPLIFADGFQGIAVFGDVVRFNAYQLVQNLDNPDGPPSRIFVARLAMSSATMGQLIKWLNDNIKIQPVPDGGVSNSGGTP